MCRSRRWLRIGSLLLSVGTNSLQHLHLGLNCGRRRHPLSGHQQPEDLMRVHHAIAIFAIVLIGFALKLTFFSAPPAEADARSVESLRMDVSQLHQNIKTLPEHKMHDMTFVFSESD